MLSGMSEHFLYNQLFWLSRGFHRSMSINLSEVCDKSNVISERRKLSTANPHHLISPRETMKLKRKPSRNAIILYISCVLSFFSLFSPLFSYQATFKLVGFSANFRCFCNSWGTMNAETKENYKKETKTWNSNPFSRERETEMKKKKIWKLSNSWMMCVRVKKEDSFRCLFTNNELTIISVGFSTLLLHQSWM